MSLPYNKLDAIPPSECYVDWEWDMVLVNGVRSPRSGKPETTFSGKMGKFNLPYS